MKDLNTENCKKLMKSIKEDTNKCKDLQCSWIGSINIVKNVHSAKQSADSIQSLLKFERLFFPKNRTILKFACNCKRPQINKIYMKKNNKAGGLIVPDFEQYYKTVVIRTV